MSMEEIRARLESLMEQNKKTEHDAEMQLPILRSKLRELASNDGFALECWRYYVNNYCGARFKSAIFNCNYLKDALSGIQI